MIAQYIYNFFYLLLKRCFSSLIREWEERERGLSEVEITSSSLKIIPFSLFL